MSYIIDGGTATISGRRIHFDEEEVHWSDILEALKKAANVAKPDGWCDYWMGVENKPDGQLIDHMYMINLTQPRDFILILLNSGTEPPPWIHKPSIGLTYDEWKKTRIKHGTYL